MALAQDQTPQTLTLPAALYPHGFKRFIDGLLASGWLVIWVFGELAVLAMMGTTIVSLIDMVVSLSLPANFPKVSNLSVASGFLMRAIFHGGPHELLPSFLTALCAASAMLLMWSRKEWVVASGRLALRRRFLNWSSELDFEDGVLELTSTVDNDGDVQYALHISTPYGDRAKIASAVDEPCELYWLAKWLAVHTHFYLDTGNGPPKADRP